MKLVIKEAIWSFKKNIKINILLILQLSIYFCLTCMLMNTFFDMGFKNYYKDFIVNDKIYYQFYIDKMPLLWNDISNNDSELENIKNFIGELRSQENFIFTKYTGSNDLIVKEYKLEEQGIYLEQLNQFKGMDTYDPNLISLQSTQMDKIGFEYFDFKVQDGRLFENADYILKSAEDKISIIIGNDYKKVFNVGDEIEFEYKEKLLTGIVVGILEKNATIYNSNVNSLNLNNQIILPFVELGYTPVSENDKSFQVDMYTENLTSANVIADVDDNNIGITNEINEICKDFGVIRYDPESTSSTNGMDLFINESKQSIKIIFTMIILVIFLSVFNFVMNIYSKIEKNSRRYLIYILQGASINNIVTSYLLEVFIIILGALGISSYLLKNEISISYKFLLLLVLMSIIVSITVSSAIVYKFHRLSSDKILRRE